MVYFLLYNKDMLKVELSYYDADNNIKFIDITKSLQKQFNNGNGLPDGLKEGIYPDNIAQANETDFWYDLIQCVNDAIVEKREEAGWSGDANFSNGQDAASTKNKELEGLKHFFDGRVHALRFHDTESSGVDKYANGIPIRVLMEYRYSSRNA